MDKKQKRYFNKGLNAWLQNAGWRPETGITSWVRGAISRMTANLAEDREAGRVFGGATPKQTRPVFGAAVRSMVEDEVTWGALDQMRLAVTRQPPGVFKDSSVDLVDFSYVLEPMPHELFERLYDNYGDPCDPRCEELPYGALPFIVVAVPLWSKDLGPPYSKGFELD